MTEKAIALPPPPWMAFRLPSTWRTHYTAHLQMAADSIDRLWHVWPHPGVTEVNCSLNRTCGFGVSTHPFSKVVEYSFNVAVPLFTMRLECIRLCLRRISAWVFQGTKFNRMHSCCSCRFLHMLSRPMPIQYNTIWYSAMQYNSTQRSTIRSNIMRCNKYIAMLYNIVQCNFIQCNEM